MQRRCTASWPSNTAAVEISVLKWQMVDFIHPRNLGGVIDELLSQVSYSRKQSNGVHFETGNSSEILSYYIFQLSVRSVQRADN